MACRLPTTRLPLLTLLVALALVGHDVGMATELHHPNPHDHGAAHDASYHGPIHQAPTGEELQCVSFEAARTSELAPDLAAVADLPYPLDAIPAEPFLPSWPGDVDPGAPPGRLRALLQVWLN